MYYVIAIISAVVCGLVAYSTLNKPIADKLTVLWLFSSSEKEQVNSKYLNKKIVYVLSASIAVTVLVCTIKLMFEVSDVINICKMLLTFLCLVGAACIDFREYRIPSVFPLILAISGVVLLIIGYFTNQTGAISYVVSSAIATVGSVLCLTLASVLTKQGIGAGDIKLIGAVSIIGGVYTVCGTLFFAMSSCAVVSAVLLIIKKKSLKDSLPFGPFILLGYAISILFSIY